MNFIFLESIKSEFNLNKFNLLQIPDFSYFYFLLNKFKSIKFNIFLAINNQFEADIK